MHVGGCPDCRGIYVLIQKVKESLGSLAVLTHAAQANQKVSTRSMGRSFVPRFVPASDWASTSQWLAVPESTIDNVRV